MKKFNATNKELTDIEVADLGRFLGDCYKPDAIDDFLSKCTLPGLYDEYVGRNDSDRKTFTILTQRLNGDGQLPHFCLVVFKELTADTGKNLTEHEKSLRDKIVACYADIDTWKITPENYVYSLQMLIQVLEGSVQEQHTQQVIDMKGELQRVFQNFHEGIILLGFYKNLHDIFHVLDNRYYGKLADDAENCTKPTPFRNFMFMQRDMEMNIASVKELVNSSDNLNDDAHEKANKGLASLQNFLKSLEKMEKNRASSDVGKVISEFANATSEYESSVNFVLKDMNNSIEASARKLNFADMVAVLETLSKTVTDANPQEGKDMEAKVVWIKDKFGNSISETIELHSTWQDLLPHLKLMESGIKERKGAASDMVPFIWNMAKQLLEQLCKRRGDEDTQKRMRAHISAIDGFVTAILDLESEQLDALENEFLLCRSAASHDFLSADKDLKEDFLAMAALRKPIDNLMEAIENA